MKTHNTQLPNKDDAEKGLKRNLKTSQLTMISMGCAIGTGLFLGSGLAIQTAGPSVLVSYAYWIANVLAVGVEVSAIAVYMKYWFPSVPGIVWILVFAAILIYVNA